MTICRSMAMLHASSGCLAWTRAWPGPLARCLAGALLVVLVLPATSRDLAAAPAPTPEGGPQSGDQGTAPQSDISAASTAPAVAPVFQDYAIHGQSTFVEQYHPAFRSAYRGLNSLDPGSRGDETFDATLFAGLRPWRNAEVWVNPEIDQGFGLSNTVGVAAFPSAEAYKIGAAVPYIRIPRLFLRQTVDLGGAVQGIAPDLNQLGGAQTANRVVLTLGKFGVADVFDTNRYAHDPRNDFMDWAIVDAGAFDYAADAWGYTYGASAEWYQDWWALRAGAFDGSVTPNSKYLETRFGAQFQAIVEAEARYTAGGRDGKVKLLGYQTRARLGRFSDLEAFYAANPGAGNVDAAVVRRLRNKYGAGLNLEQQVTTDLGLFLRASLSDGRTEAYDFTDIDRSLSGGLSLSGRRWRRPDDTVGVAYVVSNISKAHKDFLAQGYYGVLVGDGRLTNAGPEQVLETYYSYAVATGVNVSANYELVNHPAYNVDRGPVHIIGLRVHGQF